MIYQSDCCSEILPDWPDSDICQCCKEHCGVEESEPDEDIPVEEDWDSDWAEGNDITEDAEYYDNDSDFEMGGES